LDHRLACYTELQEGSNDRWEDVREGLTSALRQLREAIRRTNSHSQPEPEKQESP
jgi:hypothetical protein